MAKDLPRTLLDVGRNIVDDAGDLKVSLQMTDGSSVDLTCPADRIPPMLLLFSTALAHSQDATGVAGMKAVWPTEKAQVVTHGDGSVGLLLRTVAGAELAFAVPLDQLEQVYKELQLALEIAKKPPDDTPRH